MALARRGPQTSHAARGAHFVQRLGEQAQERKPGVRVRTGMQRDEADHVVVEQCAGLADGLVGPHRPCAIQQEIVGDDPQLNRPLRRQSRGGVYQPRQRQPDGWMRGWVEGHGTRGSFASACKIGKPRGRFLIEGWSFFFLR